MLSVYSNCETTLNVVEPGDPDKSWLLLKASGSFDESACKSCKTQMPPAGALLTTDELGTIADWIAAGATDL